MFKLISPFVILIPFVIFDFEFRNTINFYIGLCLFIAMIGISYTWELKYYLLISKIDFSSPILSIKKEIAVIEKYKIKTTRTKYIFTPFTILSIFLMFMQKPVFNNESVVLIALILVVFIFSMYFTFKYGIYGQFSKLNKDIREIEELEKD